MEYRQNSIPQGIPALPQTAHMYSTGGADAAGAPRGQNGQNDAPHNGFHLLQHAPQQYGGQYGGQYGAQYGAPYGAAAPGQYGQNSPAPAPRANPPYPVGDTPYPTGDTMGPMIGHRQVQRPPPERRLNHHASSPALQSSQTSHRPLRLPQGLPQGAQPHQPQPQPASFQQIPVGSPARQFQGHHGRSGSAGSIQSWNAPMSTLNEAKPAPKRHYIWESSAPKQFEKLSINQFEGIRRAAAQRPHEPRTQLEFAKRLVEASSQLASRYSDPQTPSTILSDKRTEQRNREAWTQLALKITKKLVSRTNMPDAVLFLAQNYSSGGMGLDVDNVKAFELYNRAAKLDQPEACYRVAVSYELGIGTKLDIEKALSWYKRAAPLNDVKSMYKLGMTFLNGGLGQQRNFREALMWLQRAADKATPNNQHAVHQLGLIYESARQDAPSDIARDNTKAFDYFSKAAAVGYTPSQVRLGRAYEFGELDRPVDPAKSLEWYTVAAQAGDSDGELGLCGWYWTGIEGSLRASDTEAFLWAERAAQKSNTRAEFALGVFYQLGVGVSVDLEKARGYYLRAHEKKHPHALQRLKRLNQM